MNPYSYCAANPVGQVDPEGTMVILGVLTKHPRRVPEDQSGLSSGSGPNWGLGTAGLGLAGTSLLMAGAGACSMMATAYEGWSDARKAQAAFSRGLSRVSRRPGDNYQAHHLIPQSDDMRRIIVNEFGPDAASVIDDGAVNGEWWMSSAEDGYHHQAYAGQYERELQQWIQDNCPRHTRDVIAHAREMTIRYQTHYP